MGPVAPAARPSNRRNRLNMSNLVKRMDLRRAKAALPWMPQGSQFRPHPEPLAVPSARPAPFLRAVMFALLALALGGVLLYSTPAEAQTATVLVKNTGQTARGIDGELNSGIPGWAQGFTTGPNATGYTLSSIGIRFRTIADTSTAGGELTASLYDATYDVYQSADVPNSAPCESSRLDGSRPRGARAMAYRARGKHRSGISGDHRGGMTVKL